jgi:NADH-quinone oxidoreductase subunit L
METLLWLAVCVPALGAVVTRFALFSPAAVAAVAALFAAVPPWLLLASDEQARSTFAWLPGGGLDVGLQLDGISALMTVTVATVGLVVVIYSAGYFDGDPRRRSALAGLLGFLAAMQGLVLADGYLALLIFWELVGAASARLIAYTRDDPAAPPAAVRAFLTTRGADLGLYLAVLALFAATGSVAFETVRPEGALGAVVGLGLVAAAMGKSAQAPLHTWLSAAMAGPTPVSALLHSATMVAAGVYLLVRSQDLLAGWPLEVAGWVGAITAVAGAAIALAQTDLKRVLASSTTSQLGLMFVGAAAGGPAVALFQLIAHAAGKAGLFLAAGVFQHRRHTTELRALRGAGREDRAAFAGFTVCALSIAAVPPFAAFWSKDHIAAAAEHVNLTWFVLVLLAAAGSAAYLLRPGRVLWGDADASPAHGRARAGGRNPMLAGVALMALGSLVIGALGTPITRLLDTPPLPTSALSIALSLLAVALGAALVLRRVAVPGVLVVAARRQLYANDLLRLVVQRPILAAARIGDVIERRGIDAAVDGLGRATISLARAADWIERRRVDAAVDGLARAIARAGRDLRRIQSGRLYEYLRGATLGAAAVAVVIALTTLT